MLGILWDCDGTIMDTERLYAYAWQTHLKEFGLSIPEDEINEVIKNLYDDRKSHIQNFILESLKTLYKDKKDEYPGDSTVKNILLNIFQDDDLCKTRLSSEIKLHQHKMRGEKSDYNKLF